MLDHSFSAVAAVSARAGFGVAALAVCLLGTSTMLPGASVLAASVGQLYGAQVSVDPQLTEPDEAAMSAAMGGVLVKLTGRRDIAAQPAAQSLMARAGDFLQQHGFAEQGQMFIGFDALSLREAVLASGLAFWGEDRPLVMVWLALDSPAQGRILVGADDRTGVRLALERDAQRRGLPIVLPLLDSEDLAAVSFADVWGRFAEPLERAAERYNADALLVGRASADASGRLFVRWRWYEGQRSDEWQGGLGSGIDTVADRLSQRFASVASAGLDQVSVSVSNLTSMYGYARVTSFLQRLSLVEDVSVTSVYGDQVSFSVATRGERAKLHRQIRSSGFLSSPSGQSFDYTYAGREGGQRLPGDRVGADSRQ